MLVPCFGRRPRVGLVVTPRRVRQRRLVCVRSLLGHPSIHLSSIVRSGDLLRKGSYLVISDFKLLSSVCQCKAVTCVNNNFKTNVRGALRTTICNVPILFNPQFRGFGRTHSLVGINKKFSITSGSRFITGVSRLLACTRILGTTNRDTNRFIGNGTNTASKVLGRLTLWTL